MVELMGIAAAAVAGTAAFAVALLPRRWVPATILAAAFVPVLAICANLLASRIAFGGLSGESGNAVGELDLWLLGLALYDIVAGVLCLGRVLLWVKGFRRAVSAREYV